MDGFTLELSFYKNLKNEIAQKNKEFLSVLQESDNILHTKEYLKIAFSEDLLNDVDFLTTLSGNDKFKTRYADLIIRNLIEQVIEFIYLLKNPEKIPDFIGSNYNDENFSINYNGGKLSDNYIESFRRFGSLRYSKGRPSISKMADNINEKRSHSDTISLYELYVLFSEDCHNSYYFSTLTALGGKEPCALTEYQTGFLITIVDRFLKAYRL